MYLSSCATQIYFKTDCVLSYCDSLNPTSTDFLRRKRTLLRGTTKFQDSVNWEPLRYFSNKETDSTFIAEQQKYKAIDASRTRPSNTLDLSVQGG